MNEIEKMYENAEIKPVVRDNAIGRGYYIEHQRTEEYPPFTAEKQLELIKWLAFRDSTTITANKAEVNAYNIGHNKYCSSEFSLEDCLARLINKLWQSLTEKEKQQIKEILE